MTKHTDLLERIEQASNAVLEGKHSFCVPPSKSDIDIVLQECSDTIRALQKRLDFFESLEATKELLGIMAFRFPFVELATLWRKNGYVIPNKIEEEKAFFLHKALLIKAEHGENWSSVFNAEVKKMKMSDLAHENLLKAHKLIKKIGLDQAKLILKSIPECLQSCAETLMFHLKRNSYFSFENGVRYAVLGCPYEQFLEGDSYYKLQDDCIYLNEIQQAIKDVSESK